MGRSKRKYNIAHNCRTQELLREIKRDLAWVPVGFVARKDAQRLPFYLTETDLQSINHLAVHGERNGQSVIFYPLGEVKALASDKEDHCLISQNMLSEATLIKQLPKDHFDVAMLRTHGFKGTWTGHRGRETYFYSVDMIEETLKIKVLGSGCVEGIDFIKENSVSLGIRVGLPAPTLCIWAMGSGRAEQCFLEPQVTDILKKGAWSKPPVRRSVRVQDKSDIGGHGPENHGAVVDLGQVDMREDVEPGRGLAEMELGGGHHRHGVGPGQEHSSDVDLDLGVEDEYWDFFH